jgi:hypothetical protein
MTSKTRSTESTPEPETSSTAVADTPRVPHVGDTIHVYSKTPTSILGKLTTHSTPARVVRVATHDDPFSILDVERTQTDIHRGVERAASHMFNRMSRLLDHWAYLDNVTGLVIPETPDRIPDIGETVGIFTHGEYGIQPTRGVVIGTDDFVLDIETSETEILKNVMFGGDNPGHRSWSWEPAPPTGQE